MPQSTDWVSGKLDCQQCQSRWCFANQLITQPLLACCAWHITQWYARGMCHILQITMLCFPFSSSPMPTLTHCHNSYPRSQHSCTASLLFKASQTTHATYTNHVTYATQWVELTKLVKFMQLAQGFLFPKLC